jgi:hypothetical protein
MVKRKLNHVTRICVQVIAWVNGQRGASAVSPAVAVRRVVPSLFPSLLSETAKRAPPKTAMWKLTHATPMLVRWIVLVLGQHGVTAVSPAVVVKVFACLPFRHPLRALAKAAVVHIIKLRLKNATPMHVS